MSRWNRASNNLLSLPECELSDEWAMIRRHDDGQEEEDFELGNVRMTRRNLMRRDNVTAPPSKCGEALARTPCKNSLSRSQLAITARSVFYYHVYYLLTTIWQYM